MSVAIKQKLLTEAGRLELLAGAAEIAADDSSSYLDIERAKVLRQCVLAAHQICERSDAEQIIAKARKLRQDLNGKKDRAADNPGPARAGKGTGAAGGVN